MRFQQLVVLFLAFLSFLTQFLTVMEAGDADFRPQQDRLPVAPPDDAVVLFDGTTNRFLSMTGGPSDWPIVEGCLVSTKKGKRANHLVSQYHFRDAELHVEFMVSPKGAGNSGIYLHGHYELQIYNSFGKTELTDQEEGALYGFAKPLVNASRPVDTWQVYDIRYQAPRRDDSGKITQPGEVTAWLNGQLVQEQTSFQEPRSKYHPFRYGSTPYLQVIAEQMKRTSVGPVFLQDHDSPARFRNIWIRPLDELGSFYEAATK